MFAGEQCGMHGKRERANGRWTGDKLCHQHTRYAWSSIVWVCREKLLCYTGTYLLTTGLIPVLEKSSDPRVVSLSYSHTPIPILHPSIPNLSASAAILLTPIHSYSHSPILFLHTITSSLYSPIPLFLHTPIPPFIHIPIPLFIYSSIPIFSYSSILPFAHSPDHSLQWRNVDHQTRPPRSTVPELQELWRDVCLCPEQEAAGCHDEAVVTPVARHPFLLHAPWLDLPGHRYLCLHSISIFPF